jgi:uncharacterized protein YjiS (DUF1127 family)
MLKQYSFELGGGMARPSGAQSGQDRHLALPANQATAAAAWPDSDRSGRWNGLASPWERVTGLWTRWRRERKIQLEVTLLAELEDRLLRDIGIPAKSQIEEIVRGWHDGH